MVQIKVCDICNMDMESSNGTKELFNLNSQGQAPEVVLDKICLRRQWGGSSLESGLVIENEPTEFSLCLHSSLL